MSLESAAMTSLGMFMETLGCTPKDPSQVQWLIRSSA